MGEYSLNDFLRALCKDMHDLLGEPRESSFGRPRRVYGVEDEFKEAVEYPTLKRLEGRVLSSEVQKSLNRFQNRIKRCEEKGYHDVAFVYSASIQGKEYITGVCGSCHVIVAKEKTDYIRKKIAEHYKSQERLMHMPTF